MFLLVYTFHLERTSQMKQEDFLHLQLSSNIVPMLCPIYDQRAKKTINFHLSTTFKTRKYTYMYITTTSVLGKLLSIKFHNYYSQELNHGFKTTMRSEHVYCMTHGYLFEYTIIIKETECSQTHHRPSQLLETIREPSLLKCTAETGSEWAGRIFRHLPVFTSQIRTLSSNQYAHEGFKGHYSSQ